MKNVLQASVRAVVSQGRNNLAAAAVAAALAACGGGGTDITSATGSTPVNTAPSNSGNGSSPTIPSTPTTSTPTTNTPTTSTPSTPNTATPTPISIGLPGAFNGGATVSIGSNNVTIITLSRELAPGEGIGVSSTNDILTGRFKSLGNNQYEFSLEPLQSYVGSVAVTLTIGGVSATTNVQVDSTLKVPSLAVSIGNIGGTQITYTQEEFKKALGVLNAVRVDPTSPTVLNNGVTVGTWVRTEDGKYKFTLDPNFRDTKYVALPIEVTGLPKVTDTAASLRDTPRSIPTKIVSLQAQMNLGSLTPSLTPFGNSYGVNVDESIAVLSMNNTSGTYIDSGDNVVYTLVANSGDNSEFTLDGRVLKVGSKTLKYSTPKTIVIEAKMGEYKTQRTFTFITGAEPAAGPTTPEECLPGYVRTSAGCVTD